MHDVADRLTRRSQLTSDGFRVYLEAVESAFNLDVDYAMLQKIYGADPQPEKRYSPAKIVSSTTEVIQGSPDPKHISTSYVERLNWSVRTSCRRYTRLSNGFSRKLPNHEGRSRAQLLRVQLRSDSPDAADEPGDGGRRHGSAVGRIGYRGGAENGRGRATSRVGRDTLRVAEAKPRARRVMHVQTYALLVVGTLLLTVPAFAQVSFSGDWIALDEAASRGVSYSSPLGDKGSIVQSNDVIAFRTVDGRARVVERTYPLDGSEMRYEATTDGVTRSYSARSRWMGAALVITTMTAAPNSGSLESMVTLSLNRGGQIEMLVLHHFPESPNTPYTHRFVYRRTVSK